MGTDISSLVARAAWSDSTRLVGALKNVRTTAAVVLGGLCGWVGWQTGTASGPVLAILALLCGSAGFGLLLYGRARWSAILAQDERAEPTERRLVRLGQLAMGRLGGRALMVTTLLLICATVVAMSFPGRLPAAALAAASLAAAILSLPLPPRRSSDRGWFLDAVIPDALLSDHLARATPAERFEAGWTIRGRIACLRRAAALHPDASDSARAAVRAQYAPAAVSLPTGALLKGTLDELRLRREGLPVVLAVSTASALLCLLLTVALPERLLDALAQRSGLAGLFDQMMEDDPVPPDEQEQATPAGAENPEDGASDPDASGTEANSAGAAPDSSGDGSTEGSSDGPGPDGSKNGQEAGGATAGGDGAGSTEQGESSAGKEGGGEGTGGPSEGGQGEGAEATGPAGGGEDGTGPGNVAGEQGKGEGPGGEAAHRDADGSGQGTAPSAGTGSADGQDPGQDAGSEPRAPEEYGASDTPGGGTEGAPEPDASNAGQGGGPPSGVEDGGGGPGDELLSEAGSAAPDGESAATEPQDSGLEGAETGDSGSSPDGDAESQGKGPSSGIGGAPPDASDQPATGPSAGAANTSIPDGGRPEGPGDGQTPDAGESGTAGDPAGTDAPAGYKQTDGLGAEAFGAGAGAPAEDGSPGDPDGNAEGQGTAPGNGPESGSGQGTASGSGEAGANGVGDGSGTEGGTPSGAGQAGSPTGAGGAAAQDAAPITVMPAPEVYVPDPEDLIPLAPGETPEGPVILLDEEIDGGKPGGSLLAPADVPPDPSDPAGGATMAGDPVGAPAPDLAAGSTAQLFAEEGEVPDEVRMYLRPENAAPPPMLAEPTAPRQLLPAWIKETLNQDDL